MGKRSKQALSKLSKCIDKKLDAFITNLHEDIKDGTPVDTGRAQRGWKKVDKYKVGERQRTIIIRNDVPYSPRLDNGYSKQAPNGMVKPALYKGRYK
jgi:hypothetical protein